MKRHTWTPADDALLRAGYGVRPTREIAAEIGVSENATGRRAQKLGLRIAPFWTPERLKELARLYASLSAQECAEVMGCSLHSIVHAVQRHGLRKSHDWIVERSRQLLADPSHPARKTRFQPGLIPHNKGKPHPATGRAAETQFKPGHKPHTWNQIGHIRESKEGYLQRKLRDTGVTRRDYVALHHMIWRMHGRCIPPGYAVRFIDGDKRNFDINNLELVRRSELMRRNSVHNHGPEIARAYQAVGVLMRQINKHTKE